VSKYRSYVVLLDTIENAAVLLSEKLTEIEEEGYSVRMVEHVIDRRGASGFIILAEEPEEEDVLLEEQEAEAPSNFKRVSLPDKTVLPLKMFLESEEANSLTVLYETLKKSYAGVGGLEVANAANYVKLTIEKYKSETDAHKGRFMLAGLNALYEQLLKIHKEKMQ